MVDASTIVSIVIAVVSLLSTVAVAVIGVFENQKRQEKEGELQENNTYLQNRLDIELKKAEEERQEKREVAALVKLYSPPLIIAAYELQARLYELLEYPISKEHLETVEGLEDIKIFTCYRFAQFLAWTYILETKTQYFSFTDDPNLVGIADII